MLIRSILTLEDAGLLVAIEQKFKELHKTISAGILPDEQSLVEIEKLIERLEKDTFNSEEQKRLVI